jgi:hypothetical protein
VRNPFAVVGFFLFAVRNPSTLKGKFAGANGFSFTLKIYGGAQTGTAAVAVGSDLLYTARVGQHIPDRYRGRY